MNRRQFIQKGTLATAGLVTSFHIPAFETQSRKVRMGVIGTGWYGMVVTKAALQTGDAEIVAICDVDTEHLKNSANELNSLQGSRPKEFADYREMLDMKGLDAVVIGTPPHWHALQFVAACKKGLHIYCEKPLSYDVEEGKAMVKAAKAAGNIVQIGFQRRQSAAFQKARQMVEDGTMGKIYQIDAQIHHVPGHRDTTIQVPPCIARLGCLVRTCPQVALQSQYSTHVVATRKGVWQRTPCRLGHTSYRYNSHCDELRLTESVPISRQSGSAER